MTRVDQVRRSARAWCLAASALACASVAGCSDLLGPDAPRLTLFLQLERSWTAAPVLRARIDGRNVEVPASPPGTARVERPVHGLRVGTVPAQVALLDAEGDTLASVELSQELRRGHLPWLGADVGVRRPLGHCIGTLAVAPLRTGGTDTLFVMYGGIPEGAIC